LEPVRLIFFSVLGNKSLHHGINRFINLNQIPLFMRNFEPIQFNAYYHVFNRGINSQTIFTEPGNYQHFLYLCQKHLDILCTTWAWCLMPNHFHMLVKVKSINEILTGYKAKHKKLKEPIVIKEPHQYFSNLCNAYAKAFNKRNERHGSLFERPFKRIRAFDKEYLKQLVLYIHGNPVHHGFTNDILDYPWSSYITLLDQRSKNPTVKMVYELFGSRSEFINMHKDIKNNLSGF